jgi:MFS transporter, ACS family, hexuronate transporter
VTDGQTDKKLTALAVGWTRWGICALLFFATALNYVDRQILGLLKPVLEKGLNWNERDFSYIVMAFTVAYAIGYSGAGWFIDRVGVKVGYFLAVLLWSLAEMAHALNWYIPSEAKIEIGRAHV